MSNHKKTMESGKIKDLLNLSQVSEIQAKYLANLFGTCWIEIVDLPMEISFLTFSYRLFYKHFRKSYYSQNSLKLT